MSEEQEFDAMANDPDLVISVEFDARHYHAAIGDQQHGYIAAVKTRTFGAAVHWLQRQAQRRYPASRYVRELPTRGVGASWPGGRMTMDTRGLVH